MFCRVVIESQARNTGERLALHDGTLPCPGDRSSEAVHYPNSVERKSSSRHSSARMPSRIVEKVQRPVLPRHVGVLGEPRPSEYRMDQRCRVQS